MKCPEYCFISVPIHFNFGSFTFLYTHTPGQESQWPSGRASDSGARGQGFDPHSGRRVVSLSKIHLPPKSTGNTQEAVAPSRHD